MSLGLNRGIFLCICIYEFVNVCKLTREIGELPLVWV
jgi:hypothetical protein